MQTTVHGGQQLINAFRYIDTNLDTYFLETSKMNLKTIFLNDYNISR